MEQRDVNRNTHKYKNTLLESTHMKTSLVAITGAKINWIELFEWVWLYFKGMFSMNLPEHGAGPLVGLNNAITTRLPQIDVLRTNSDSFCPVFVKDICLAFK